MTPNLRPDGGPLPTPDWLADILARCDWYQETEPKHTEPSELARLQELKRRRDETAARQARFHRRAS